MTEVERGTSTLILRAVSRGEDLSMAEVVRAFESINGLIYVGSILAFQPPRAYPENDTRRNLARNYARASVENAVLLRLSYNSPMEVVFALSGAIGSVSLASTALIGVWNRLQNARVTTSDANLRIAMNRQITKELGEFEGPELTAALLAADRFRTVEIED